jgi:hypothetical protein
VLFGDSHPGGKLHFDEAQGTSVVLEETRHLADRQFIGGYPAGTEDRGRVRD